MTRNRKRPTTAGMLATSAVAAWVVASCANEKHVVRADAADYGVRKIAVVVRATSAPVDAVRGYEFAAQYPPLPEPESALPPAGPAGDAAAAALKEELGRVLAGRGYELASAGNEPATVRAALDGAASAGVGGVLVVVVTPVRRWAVARVVSSGTTSRSALALERPPEERAVETAIHEGMLLLPSACLYEARSGVRLWMRRNFAVPAAGHLEPASPLLGLAFPRAAGAEPSEELETRTAARQAAERFFDTLPNAATIEPSGVDIERWRNRAVVDRLRDEQHLFVSVGFTRAEEPLGATATPAPGVSEEVKAQLVEPGGASGPSLTLAYLRAPLRLSATFAGYAGGRSSGRTWLRRGDDGNWYQTHVGVSGSWRLEGAVAAQVAWVATPWLVVSGGLEGRLSRLTLFADPATAVDAERTLFGGGGVLEADFLWRSLQGGPVVVGGVAADGGRIYPYFRWTVQAGWRF